MKKNLYFYDLPDYLIAKKPAVPRDSSKIFIYDTARDIIFFDKFFNVDKYFPKESFLVLNNTKVMPARVNLKKENGGKVNVLFFINEINNLKNLKIVKGLVDRKINTGEKVFFNKKNFISIVKQEKNIFYFELNFSYEKFLQLLERYGEMPIPLYLRKTSLKKQDLFKRYQTVFALKKGSIAAPTASLHFTNRVFKKLEKKGIKRYFVTLHIGMGTFAPVTEDNLKLKRLHKEYYEIENDVWNKIIDEKNKGNKLIAVGTTVVRTLESAVRSSFFQKLKSVDSAYIINSKTDFHLAGETSLFIFPPFDFKLIDILITNFHLPNSSLMMLVEAFLNYKKAKKNLIDLYNIAIKNNFRFYSFGDAMLII